MNKVAADQGLEQVKAYFQEEYKKISFRESLYLEFAKRPDPSGSIEAATLDDFMEQSGFRRLGASWRELSRTAAEQYVQRLMRAEQINFSEYDQNRDVSFQLAKLFIEQFEPDARFFTNGLMELLDEHPIIDEATPAAIFRFPFAPEKERKALYYSYQGLTNDPLDQVLFGVVAVGQKRLGYLFVEGIAG
jgi:hypothetical protein